MKRKFFKLAMSMLFGLFLTTIFVSCVKEEIDPPDDFTPDLIGKWNVSNAGAEYSSFEFTKDKMYIIQQRVSSLQSAPANSILKSSSSEPNTVYIIIIFGDYSTLSADGGVYNLDLGDFGLIKITISESGATVEVNGEVFDITRDGNSVTGNQAKTELLCHAWNWLENDESGILTFTPNGTYLTYLEEYPEYAESGTWKWLNSNNIEVTHTNYIYSWGSGGELEVTEKIVTQKVKIVELTETELTASWEEDDESYLMNLTR
ncbi:MAG: copper resistance protein NlpE [Prevotellaceae bacterium]|jgi:hypothetical protein|nr:copper resistance protein NlpE [Prevotellaceae bacterium]